MKVTKAWLDSVKSAKGGYSSKQLRLIGISWPPKSGWMKDVIGKEIDDAIAQQVEQLGRGKPTASK